MMKIFQYSYIGFLIIWSHTCPAAELALASSDIPEGEIAALQKELQEAASPTSAIAKRRAYKNVARDGENLLQANPLASNRWHVMGVIFDSRKYLFSMENSDLNRKELLEVCAMLADAPDEYADIRLEADVLLSEKKLSDSEADIKDRVAALEALTARYRDTSAEAKCLIIASQIAEKLGEHDVRKNMIQTLTDRFAGDPAVIDWCRQNLAVGQMDILFTGAYTRADGVTLKFPYDVVGHAYVVVFWSKTTPDIEAYLKHIGALQESYDRVFRVYSFNVDELPDAGQSLLKKLELDWVAMRLPGGRNASAYRTYAQGDPSSLFCNGFSRALLMPSFDANREADPLKRATLELSVHRVPEDRHLAQLQALSIGDFLVTARGEKIDPAFPPEMQMVCFDADVVSADKLNLTADSISEQHLSAIQACFTPSPLRYRLTTSQALTNYRMAHRLCLDALRQYPRDPNSWIVRNRLIVALLGMWNLSGEPEFLEHAAVHARTLLAEEVPAAAAVVARFCLTKLAIRHGGTKPEALLAELIEDSGGDSAPASAYAAAAILALDAHERDLHVQYRDKFPEWGYDGNPSLWTVTSFLRDRFHRHAMLKANYIYNRHHRSPRGYIANLGRSPLDIQMPEIALKTLDGKVLRIPEDTKGKLTLLVFVEPPEVINTQPELDAKGNPKPETPYAIMTSAIELADRHINKDLNVIAAFLCDEPRKVEAVMKMKGWMCQAAMVPEGLANPIVQRLGIQSADRIPNPFLLRRDGTVAWDARGLEYKGAGDTLFAMLLAMKVQIEACEVEYACRALEKGNYKEAARVFGGPYLPWPPDRFGWRAPRYHGQALAYIGLKDWTAALESIEKAIDAQKLRYYQAMVYDKDAAKWREQAATVTINHPDDTLVELWSIRADILDNLGRKNEAAEMRKRAAEPATPDIPSPYKSIHTRLNDWHNHHHNEAQKP